MLPVPRAKPQALTNASVLGRDRIGLLLFALAELRAVGLRMRGVLPAALDRLDRDELAALDELDELLGLVLGDLALDARGVRVVEALRSHEVGRGVELLDGDEPLAEALGQAR